MISKTLQEARDFEKKYIHTEDLSEYPEFHVTGGVGWINDPNGFSRYKDEYHLFYQYHPYSRDWGPMHWGHVTTKDFVNWKRLPVALAPDTNADKDGCFSGSAIELDDGRMALFYTGRIAERDKDGRIVEYQDQCVAIGDGVDFEKYDGNPIISRESVPEGNSKHDFRDPKVYKEGDSLFMVVGSRAKDGSGEILLYKSEDVFHWTFQGVVDACKNVYVKMWECPDFFELDGKQVLLTSPQEMAPVGIEFHAGFGTLCAIGNYDRQNVQLDRETVHAIDYGIDFYAPQTLLTTDGRRIMIAWMQNWSTSSCKPPKDNWFGSMTLPRELHVKDGRLIQTPVKELEKYRKNKIGYRNVIVSKETNLPGVKGRVIDLTVKVKPIHTENMYNRFKLCLAKDGEHGVEIRCKPKTGTVRIDRTRSGGRFDIVHTRDIPVQFINGGIELRVIIDKCSVELFINNGEQAATFLLYSPLNADSISFEADECVIVDVEKYDIEVEKNFQWKK